MKNYTKILFAVLTWISFNMKGQLISPPQTLDIIMQVAANDTTMMVGDTLFKTNTALVGKAIVLLDDTIGVSKVYLKLGTSDGSSDLKNKTFQFNEQGDFNDGTSFNRVGNILYIGLGNYTGLNTYYGEVKLEDTQGVLTTTVKFNSQN